LILSIVDCAVTDVMNGLQELLIESLERPMELQIVELRK